MKIIFFFWGGGGGRRVWGQGGCDPRSEVFVKIKKKKNLGGGGRVGPGVRSGVGEGVGVARFGVGG